MPRSSDSSIAEVLERALISPNVGDSNGESANPVDVIDKVASAINSVAKAIYRLAAAAEKIAEKP